MKKKKKMKQNKMSKLSKNLPRKSQKNHFKKKLSKPTN